MAKDPPNRTGEPRAEPTAERERTGFDGRDSQLTVPIDLAALNALLNQSGDDSTPDFGPARAATAESPPASCDAEAKAAEDEFASDGESIADAVMRATGDFVSIGPVTDPARAARRATPAQPGSRAGSQAARPPGERSERKRPAAHSTPTVRARPASVTPRPAGTPAKPSARAPDLLRLARDQEDNGNLAAALRLCETASSLDPEDEVARKSALRLREVLGKQAEVRLGGLHGVPVLQVTPQVLQLHALDPRAAFLLSQIDGRLSYQDLLSVSGMSRFETLLTLAKLHAERLIKSA